MIGDTCLRGDYCYLKGRESLLGAMAPHALRDDLGEQAGHAQGRHPLPHLPGAEQPPLRGGRQPGRRHLPDHVRCSNSIDLNYKINPLCKRSNFQIALILG